MAKILVTGAAGFVGHHMCRFLAGQGHQVIASVRSPGSQVQGAALVVAVGSVGASTDWSVALHGVDFVVHCAALAHQDPGGREEEYVEVNARGVRTLAQQSVVAGVRKFVLLSTLKVNGELTPDSPFTADAPCHPLGIYAISKFQGEQFLRDIAASTSMRYSVIRPPLVYGPGVRANFLRLMRWIDRGYPIPFGAVRNRRSLVGVDNLCSLVQQVVGARGSDSEDVLLASDGEDLSTPDLIRRLAAAMDCRPRLLPVPVAFLRAGGRLLRRGEEIDRLCGSLYADISGTRRVVGWSPPVPVTDAIAKTAAWYRLGRNSRAA